MSLCRDLLSAVLLSKQIKLRTRKSLSHTVSVNLLQAVKSKDVASVVVSV